MACPKCGNPWPLLGSVCPNCGTDRQLKPEARSEEDSRAAPGSAAAWRSKADELRDRLSKRTSFYAVQVSELSEVLELLLDLSRHLDSKQPQPHNGADERSQEAEKR